MIPFADRDNFVQMGQTLHENVQMEHMYVKTILYGIFFVVYDFGAFF